MKKVWLSKYDAPLTLKCPIGGEEWPTTSYTCNVDTRADTMTPRHVHFFCPAGHDFSLSRALRSKMFTREQGRRILNGARKVKRSATQM